MKNRRITLDREVLTRAAQDVDAPQAGTTSTLSIELCEETIKLIELSIHIITHSIMEGCSDGCNPGSADTCPGRRC